MRSATYLKPMGVSWSGRLCAAVMRLKDLGTLAAAPVPPAPVRAGSAGAFTLEGLRRYIIEQSKVRIAAFLNISCIGLVAWDYELTNIDLADVALSGVTGTMLTRFNAVETIDVKSALMADRTVDASHINVDTFHEKDAILREHCARVGYDAMSITIKPGWTTDVATLDAAERKS